MSGYEDELREDELALDLPKVLKWQKEIPRNLLHWYVNNIRDLVCHPRDDRYDLTNGMPYLIQVHELLEEWIKVGAIHSKDANVKALRHWWKLFAHLYLPESK